MPVFSPRNKVQILRGMVSRVVARSALVGLTRNSVVFHILSASAEEDAEQYFELARLRSIFSLDNATGSDLDERGKEIEGAEPRRGALYAHTTLDLSRAGTTGNVPIDSGTIVAGQGDESIIRFKTTENATILDGNTSVTDVSAVALEAGSSSNLSAGAINQFITRVPGVTAVTNPTAITSGQDRESDESYLARLKAYVQGLSRATKTALESAASNVSLPNGRRVVFAKAVAPIIPDGTLRIYIDDGTGFIEEFSDLYLGTVDTVIGTAAGGETRLNTQQWPIRDDNTFVLYKNAATLFRNVDYFLDPTRGMIEMASPLSPGDTVEANYRYFTGLIRETQKVISGVPSDANNYPGVQCEGVRNYVLSPQVVPQSLAGFLSVLPGFDLTEASAKSKTAIQEYINSLSMGENVVLAEIYGAVVGDPQNAKSGVGGVSNLKITDLSGSSPPVDQIILDNQVPRISAGNISLI